MSSKIIITGAPRSGKSTLIRQLIDKLKDEYSIIGFMTPEIREKGNRIGFKLKDITTSLYETLALKGNYNTGFQLGSYNIFVDRFENFLDVIFKDLINGNKTNLLIMIDEIGKMELMSNKFQIYLKRLFKEEYRIIATMGLHITHPLIEYIKNLPNIVILQIDWKNNEKILRKIHSLIKKGV